MILDVVKINFAFLKALETIDEVAPDLASLRVGQILVMKRQLNARLEGFIKGADAVRG